MNSLWTRMNLEVRSWPDQIWVAWKSGRSRQIVGFFFSACQLLILIVLFFLTACSTDYEEPEISLENYFLEEGFKLEVIASEPLIQAPVAMDFDVDGRMWVVEMPGYMPNIDGKGEEEPTGRIVILEDLDGDGRMDHSKVFLDSLVLPRALALVYNGLLYAEPPNLWFVEINQDCPGNKTLIDSLYAPAGNVEHQPNGLVLNLDNWIYNAKSNRRYRLRNGKWEKETTILRGQWGLTHDDDGRLFYNDNSNQLQGDFVPPGLLSRNPHLPGSVGLQQQINSNQRVYPLHATSINRGYMEGVLDENQRLKHFTSACGPLIYRGDQFPDTFYGNAFVCAPEANLVKRNIVERKGHRIQARHAYTGKEFLAAREETFRPVNLFNAPDGTIYVLDMHKGVIQHRAYMTTYLRDQLLEKGLDTLVNKGRILRIAHTDKSAKKALNLSSMNSEQLLELFHETNAWTRDKAQQLLVERKAKELIPQLKKILLDSDNSLAQIHALWTLEGLDALHSDVLAEIDIESDPRFLVHVIRLMARFPKANQLWEKWNAYFALDQMDVDLALAFSAGPYSKENPKQGFFHLKDLLVRHPQDTLMLEAAISGLEGVEEDFRRYLVEEGNFPKKALPVQWLDQAIHLSKKESVAERRRRVGESMDFRTRGMQLYETHCSVCHGLGGKGIQNLAPPLANSEYVEGSEDRLILIVLHGLKGPIRVKGKQYELNAVMPGLRDNSELKDEDIAAILTFVKNAFAEIPSWIRPDRVGVLREETPMNGTFTEEELNNKLNALSF